MRVIKEGMRVGVRHPQSFVPKVCAGYRHFVRPTGTSSTRICLTDVAPAYEFFDTLSIYLENAMGSGLTWDAMTSPALTMHCSGKVTPGPMKA